MSPSRFLLSIYNNIHNTRSHHQKITHILPTIITAAGRRRRGASAHRKHRAEYSSFDTLAGGFVFWTSDSLGRRLCSGCAIKTIRTLTLLKLCCRASRCVRRQKHSCHSDTRSEEKHTLRTVNQFNFDVIAHSHDTRTPHTLRIQ